MYMALVLAVASSAALQLPARSTRRNVVGLAAASASLAAAPAHAERSRTDGYAVQRTEREWAYVLSGEQYFILRKVGTDQPNTSPLYTEKRAGTFYCAACDSKLFSSDEKFNSGTGWPSFARRRQSPASNHALGRS